MSSPFDHASRRERLRHHLGTLGVGLFLVTRPVNVRYLTGFSGDSTALLCLPGKELLVSDGRYTSQLERECPGLEVFIRPTGVTLPMALGEVLRSTGAKSVGFESAHVSVADLATWQGLAKGADWKPCGDTIEAFRLVKDDIEIAAIRRAIAMAERAYQSMEPLFDRVATEEEAAAELEHHMRRQGAAGAAFPTIVGAGANAALPHYHPKGGVPLAGASHVLVDWGAQEEWGYRSDLTRVKAWHPVPGTPTLNAAHAAVVEAQAAGALALRPGNTAGDVDLAVREVLARHGVEELFLHGTGHGIGMDIHEAPFFRPGNSQRLESGMVVTLEPGIYCPERLGVRVEDDFLVTREGGVRLSHLPRELGLELG